MAVLAPEVQLSAEQPILMSLRISTSMHPRLILRIMLLPEALAVEVGLLEVPVVLVAVVALVAPLPER